MHRRSLGFAVAVVVFLLAACGGGTVASSGASEIVSCDETGQLGAYSFHMCMEATGMTPDQINALQSTCHAGLDGGTPIGDSGQAVQVNGQFSDAGCSHIGALGGCRIASGSSSETIWYYTGSASTVDNVKVLCSQMNGTFVAP
jgi:hypothetical protein